MKSLMTLTAQILMMIMMMSLMSNSLKFQRRILTGVHAQKLQILMTEHMKIHSSMNNQCIKIILMMLHLQLLLMNGEKQPQI